MRRITYDSATVNISVFIEQRNISFQNDISLKTMRLGVLSWEKLKHPETHGRIVSLDQLRLGVEEQLLIFSSCLSPGRVKKLQKFINFCLKVGHSANLKHSKSTRQLSCDSCERYKISTSRNGNDLRQLSFWYRALSCGADWFTEDVYIWVTNLHNAVPTITCSLRYATPPPPLRKTLSITCAAVIFRLSRLRSRVDFHWRVIFTCVRP